MIDLQTHHADCWRALSDNQRSDLLCAGRQIVMRWSDTQVRLLQAERMADPKGWSSPYHFGAGMAFRNALRNAGIADHTLPSGNLDDYYVTVIERLLDERTSPEARGNGPYDAVKFVDPQT